MFYLVRIPWILKKIYHECIWDIPTTEKILYLTFDDGPHPEATPFVLEELEKYNAKATFFCIGKNVAEHTYVYHDIIARGHAAGNHTFNHLNGWKTDDREYLENILKASKVINSDLFRPPYGRIKKSQLKILTGDDMKMKTIMWSVLSGDFDTEISGQECYHTVTRHARPGSIITFHDSQKALPRLTHALPLVLKYFSERGFEFRGIEFNSSSIVQ